MLSSGRALGRLCSRGVWHAGFEQSAEARKITSEIKQRVAAQRTLAAELEVLRMRFQEITGETCDDDTNDAAAAAAADAADVDTAAADAAADSAVRLSNRA